MKKNHPFFSFSSLRAIGKPIFGKQKRINPVRHCEMRFGHRSNPDSPTLKIFFLFLTIILLSSTSLHAKTAVYFSPSLDCETQVIKLIDTASKKIDVAVYSLSNVPIVNALKRAASRGITMRILTDRLQASGKYALALDMYTAGLNVRVHSKHQIEHNKFMVVDSDKMITGSYNWTDAATWRNSENCLVIWEDPATTTAYEKRFEYLWEVNTATKSDQFFKNRLN